MLSVLIGTELGEQHRQALARYLETGQRSPIGREREMTIRRRDGSKVVISLSFSVAENMGRLYCTGLIRDLSDFKALQQKILDAERLAALGRTVAEISHEIKNPLITIGGLARQLQAQQMDKKTKFKLQVIATEVERLENLLIELRDLYRPRKLDLSQFDMMDLLREVKDLLAGDLERKKIQLTFSPAFGGTRVQADRIRIKQVLLNVLKNGVEAMEDGGNLSLQIISGPATVEVIVKDSGPGVAPELQERIFDPFFTTKRQGTGLGLSISKRIVEEHEGGLLHLKSEKGLGTEVRISLPRLTE
ncbi:MAG: ATP-binding protein [Deltaproteobacteria bacterium]